MNLKFIFFEINIYNFPQLIIYYFNNMKNHNSLTETLYQRNMIYFVNLYYIHSHNFNTFYKFHL